MTLSCETTYVLLLLSLLPSPPLPSPPLPSPPLPSPPLPSPPLPSPPLPSPPSVPQPLSCYRTWPAMRRCSSLCWLGWWACSRPVRKTLPPSQPRVCAWSLPLHMLTVGAVCGLLTEVVGISFPSQICYYHIRWPGFDCENVFEYGNIRMYYKDYVILIHYACLQLLDMQFASKTQKHSVCTVK